MRNITYISDKFAMELKNEDPGTWRMGKYLLTLTEDTEPFICEINNHKYLIYFLKISKETMAIYQRVIGQYKKYK